MTAVTQTELDAALVKLKSEITGCSPMPPDESLAVRQVAEANRMAVRKENFKQVAALDDKRLKAIGEANKALVAFRDALQVVKKTAQTEAKVWSKLGDVPVVLQQGDILATLGGCVVVELGEIPDCRGGFGPIRFSGSCGLYAAGSDWKAKETKRIQPFMKLLEAKNGR
jgi:hypothetical protein